MKKLCGIASIFVVIISLHLLLYFSGILPFFDFRFFDVMSKSVSTTIEPESSSIVIVEIDEHSLQALGQWPWPRIVLAKVLQEILVQQPAAVGFDIFFPEADRTSPSQLKSFYKDLLGIDITVAGFPPSLQNHDLILADVLASGPTVLPMFATNDTNTASCAPLKLLPLPVPDSLKIGTSNSLLCNIPVLQQSAHGFGFINAAVDSDGVLRRQPLIIRHQQQVLLSLALAMLAQVDPDIQIHPTGSILNSIDISFMDKSITVNQRGEFLNHLYEKQSFNRISASTLIAGGSPPNLFSGKMVLIGASAAGLYDNYTTSSGKTIPGVFANASLIENIIHGKGLYQPEITKLFALVISVFLSLVVAWLVLKRHYLISWGLYLTSTIVSIVGTVVALHWGCYVSLGYFLTSFSLLFFFISLFFAILHYIERKRFLEDMSEAHSATIDSMTMVAESRDVETGTHIIRTKRYVVTLAQALIKRGYYRSQLNQHVVDLLYRAAPLHDVGKVGIPDSILKKEGPLNEAEIEIMKTHVDMGQAIIENAISNYNHTNEFLIIASNMTYSHHEKWDGSGYPLGLKGKAIPLEGRLMALADVYDALTTQRCYKDSIPFEKAEQMIIEDSGTHFDPLIVQMFRDHRNDFKNIALNSQDKQLN